MMILGLILVACAVGLGVDAVLENPSSISVDTLGTSFSLSPGWLFVAGIATGVIGLLGLSMVVTGMARARRRRASLAESKESVQSLQAERDRLAVELERERNARTATAGAPHAEASRVEARREERPADIDVSDRRFVESAPADDVTRTGRTGERTEPVGSGRHGLFQRRH